MPRTVSSVACRVLGSSLPNKACLRPRTVRCAGLLSAAAATSADAVADDVECLIGQARMKFIVGEQLGSAVEILRQVCTEKSAPACYLRADIVERLFETHAVERLRAVREQLRKNFRDAFLARRVSVSGAVTDMAIHGDRVADTFRLDDQRNSVRQRAHNRIESRRRHLKALTTRSRPRREARSALHHPEKYFRCRHIRPPKPPARPHPQVCSMAVDAFATLRYLRATLFTSATVTFSMRARSSLGRLQAIERDRIGPDDRQGPRWSSSRTRLRAAPRASLRRQAPADTPVSATCASIAFHFAVSAFGSGPAGNCT